MTQVSDAKSKVTREREINKKIGSEIKRIRTRIFKMSQAQACDHVFGSDGMQAQWSRWERGEVRPNVETLAKIARKADLPLSVFGELASPPTPTLDAVGMEALRYHLTAALSLVLGVDPPRPMQDLEEWVVALLGDNNNGGEK